MNKEIQPDGENTSVIPVRPMGGKFTVKGSIASRGKDTWLIRFYLPGTKKQKSVTFKGSYEDAELELARLLREAKTGFFTEPEKITVAELLDKWLAVKKGKVKETSWYHYAKRTSVWKNIGLGPIPIQKLNAIDIESALAKLTGSNRTKLLSYAVLKMALKKSVQWKLIPYNPMDAVEPPRAERKEMQVWTEEEAARFLKAAQKNKHYMLFYLALKTGARLGELLGLEWRNVDLDKREIRIMQTLANLPEGRKSQSPKTKRSVRRIPLDKPTIVLLRQYKKQSSEDARRLGHSKIPWVFWSDRTGKPPTQQTIFYHVHRLAALARVPDIHFHCLRHTHATILLRQGVHLKIVAERLGHETLTMTDMYSHVLPDSQKEAVKALEKLGF